MKHLNSEYNCDSNELPLTLTNELDTFISETQSEKKSGTIDLIKSILIRVFCYLYSRFKLCTIANITFDMIYCLYNDCVLQYKSTTSKRVMYYTGYLLEHMYGKGTVSYGISIVISYILKFKRLIWRINDDNIIYEIRKCKNDKEGIRCTLEQFKLLTENVIKTMEKLNYSHSRLVDYRNSYAMIYLFLEENDLIYSKEIVYKWYNTINDMLTVHYRSACMRSINILNDYLETGAIAMDCYYIKRNSSLDFLPDWCKNGVIGYLEFKKLQGCKITTIKTQKSQICRFCKFIVDNNIKSFSEIKSGTIKLFNIYDEHFSVEAKSGCNITIRNFLRYLYDVNLIENEYLWNALPTVCAEGEAIVNILEQKEIKLINEATSPESDKLSLLDKALVLIGLKMGLRPIDIVNLKICDVNLNEGIIKFIQQKTQVEVALPIPVDVGNAIYRYVDKARPKRTTSPYLFVPNRVHREAYCVVACNNALRKILPDCGFRSLRKTFATNSLRGGIGVRRVAELLGHSSLDATHKYLYLDEERIMKCTMSLEDAGISILEDF